VGRFQPLPKLFAEEERSKQPSAFPLRALIGIRNPEDSRLALIGAWMRDLLFQFEPIEKKLPRSGHKDMHLFPGDDIYFPDRKKEQIERYQHDFEAGDGRRWPRSYAETVPRLQSPACRRATSDHSAEEYMANVDVVRGNGSRRHRKSYPTDFNAPYKGKASQPFLRMQEASQAL
jgi:anthranilate synthase